MFDWATKTLKERQERERGERFYIRLGADSFSAGAIAEDSPRMQSSWGEICEIRGSVREILGAAVICVAVQTARDEWWEVCQQDEGYQAFVEAMNAHCRITWDWQSDLASRETGADPIIVYRRSETAV